MMYHPLKRWTGSLTLVLGAYLLVGGSISAAEPAPIKVATVEGVTEYKLANGLRILLFPEDSRPQVTVNLTVLVGSRHEGYGESGMAHLLEHVNFRGTPSFVNPRKALHDHGANFNGTTWYDRTNYYETLPATDANLEFALQLESERLGKALVRRDDLIAEMPVVRNEFEMGENNPEPILTQRMLASAYEWHNYGKSTIGNRSDIERVPIDSLRAFYQKHYRPDNAVLIVAGKFDETKALASISQYFGPLKNPADALRNTYTEEPAQDGERTVTLRRVGSTGAVGVVYHVPASAHADHPSISLLAGILSAAPAGRLYKGLVEKKFASQVSAAAWDRHDPGILLVTASVQADKLDAARSALIETLEGLAKTPITAEEVDRARIRWVKSHEQMLDSAEQVSHQLSEWSGRGDWRLFFLNRDRMSQVTAADVNRVAAKYLTRTNRTVGEFVPTSATERVAIPSTPIVGDLVKNYHGGKGVARGEVFQPSPENIEKRIRRGELETGVKTAFLVKKTRGETVCLQLNLRFGTPESLTGRTAAAEALGNMMRRGTRKYARQELQDELDRLGAQLGVSSSRGMLTASLQLKRPNLPAALELLEEVLRRPSFPADEFEVMKRERIASLEKTTTDPESLASSLLFGTLWPFPASDVRYYVTIAEQIDRIKALTLEQVKDMYARQIGGTVGELAVVGDFDADATKAAFGAMLKGWKSDVSYQRIDWPAQSGIKAGTQTIRTPDKANAVHRTGLVFPLTDSDPDYPALEMGNYVFGEASRASRLYLRIRYKESLSYHVYSSLSAFSTDRLATFTTYAIASPKNMPKLEAAIREELTKFLADGPTAKELNELQQPFFDRYDMWRSNDSYLAGQLSHNLFIGRTFQFAADREKKIKALQPADIKAAFQKYIVPENLVIIRAGDLPKD